mmetsp:Transcript_5142/g.7893  ORF Transcript_5142/g.7893 Transcript_5142/m.7893 type:complete len:90 (+) Transcript_5142:1790-2059(+)
MLSSTQIDLPPIIREPKDDDLIQIQATNVEPSLAREPVSRQAPVVMTPVPPEVETRKLEEYEKQIQILLGALNEETKEFERKVPPAERE